MAVERSSSNNSSSNTRRRRNKQRNNSHNVPSQVSNANIPKNNSNKSTWFLGKLWHSIFEEDTTDGNSSKNGGIMSSGSTLQTVLIVLNVVLAVSWVSLYTLLSLEKQNKISLEGGKKELLWQLFIPNVMMMQRKIEPVLCIEKALETSANREYHGLYGYKDWKSLRAAVHAANSHTLEPNNNTNTFILCPGTTFNGYRRKSDVSIFINSPSVTIQCPGNQCLVHRSGTHFAFGSLAKGVTVKGITFKGARTTSQVLHINGASVSYLDCSWEDNAGDKGSIIDINSKSKVNFYRCEMEKRLSPKADGFGAMMGTSINIRK